MPLVRCEVRNEYGLGQPELYREVNNEDPKAVLDGVAVAGLVGILRQLGDLAEFAAEVFHGIQEQVLITATRSHKLIVRVQNIEAKLPPLEKAVLAQTSHIHFAYTAGSRWHACIRENNNLFTYNDLPWFIMNSYEVCRGPPRLHLLDRFDSGGPGSCIKRYSDPTFFRRTSDNSNEFGAEKIQKVRKTHRAKKKRSSCRTKASAYNFASVSSQSGRIHLNPTISNGHASSSSHTASTARRSSRRTEVSAHSESLSNHSSRIKSTTSTVIGQASPSCSFDSRARSSFIEYSLGSSETSEQQQSNASSSFIHHHDIPNSGSLDRQLEVADYFPQKSSPEHIATSSSSVTWDEKVEVVEWWYTQQSDEDEDPEILITNSDLGIQQTKTDKGENVDKENVLLAGVNPPKSSSSDGVESEPDNYVDALNAIESESESDLDCQMKHEVEKLASCVEEEGGYGELNEATMHVDEVPLKAESIAVHGLFTENELTSDLVDSIFSNYAVHEETCHSPGFEGSRSSDGIDNSNTEFTVSCAVESDSENDHDYQMKHEPENLASCVGVQEELNEAMMHVADEVPLKMESIAAHDLFTENELTTDLRNPIFSNYAGQAETSDIEVTNSIPDHSPGFEGSKGSDAIDNSKAEFIVSNVVESESENDHDCQMKQGVKKLASCVDKEGVQEEFNEAMMHVADEVPLKTQSIAVHDLFIENEHTSDLLNSVFLNCAVQAEISDNAVTYLMPHHSPSFEGSKSSDAIDKSKAEFTVGNAVESMSENDLHWQMKCEVEKLASCLDKEVVQEELNKATMLSLKTESIAANDLFTENEHTSDISNTIFLNCAVQAETSGNAVTYSEPDHSPGFEGPKSSDAIDNSKAKFIVSNPSSETSNQDQLLSDKTITASCNSQVSLDTTTSIPPVSLWTNGGLLGLEPSKPPDFVVLGNSGRDSVFTEASALGPENHTSILNEKCEKGKAEKLSTGRDLSSHDSTSRHGCQDVEIGKTRDSHLVDGSYRFYVGGVNEKGATLQNQLLVDANVEASSNEACPENDGNSFQIFPFGNRFFVNNFCRRMPSVTEDRLEPDSSLRKVALEQNGRHVNAPQTTHWKAVNGDFGQEPSVESLTSSPPLEHMKISFRPFGGFESSKLQLKLPVGKSCNGSVRDTFLSFQLVPEPCTSLQVSDSEEDTFCRSSPYMSDESASHHSESDSELWESGESLDHKDHLLYDETLGRISSVDLGSGCLDPDDIDPNRLQHEPECKNAFTENDANLPLYVSSSGPLPFNAVNSVPHEEIENKLKTIMYPMPPPLPPAQWVILKPPSAVENDQQHATFDAVDQASDTKPLECTVHQCPKQESDDGQVNCEATAINANGKEQEKLSLQSEANNTANDKEIDTNEDFLHQIRTKSFKLKPTTTAKTLFTRDPTENDKFATRLLRRAISIRQAVGSDDGEDNWSDT